MKLYFSLTIGLLFIWTGCILSISFMEAPLKFTAPNITTELGLGIGRIIFHTLNNMELFFCFSILVGFLNLKVSTVHWFLFSIIIIILVYQTALLLPQLDERAELFLIGNKPPGSYHHWLYIIMDGIKLVVLPFLGYQLLNLKLKRDDSSGSIN